MIGKTNGKRAAGAVSGEKYYIATTYPPGSTCTCTNGIYTFNAEDTSGVYVYTVPSTGNWTVSSTDGSNTKSKVVTITNLYPVTIEYYFDWNAEGTSGWSIGNKCENTSSYILATVTMEETQEGYMRARSGKSNGWPQGTVYLSDPIDFTAFSTLTIAYIYDTPARYETNFSIWSQEPNDGTPMAENRVLYQQFKPTAGGTYEREEVIDVSNATGYCYFGLDIETSGGAYTTVTVKSIHIE